MLPTTRYTPRASRRKCRPRDPAGSVTERSEGNPRSGLTGPAGARLCAEGGSTGAEAVGRTAHEHCPVDLAVSCQVASQRTIRRWKARARDERESSSGLTPGSIHALAVERGRELAKGGSTNSRPRLTAETALSVGGALERRHFAATGLAAELDVDGRYELLALVVWGSPELDKLEAEQRWP
jgi:hypothetical protein